MQNNIQIQKVKFRPRIVGEYSHVFTIPAWWIRINGKPEFLEAIIRLNKLEIRPLKEEKGEDSG